MDFKPEGREVILNQPLSISILSIMREKYIFLKWWQVGILRVRDVLYEVREVFFYQFKPSLMSWKSLRKNMT